MISDYFTAVNKEEVFNAASCFAEQAHVHDESQDYQGREAVRNWIAGAALKYRPKNEVLRMRRAGEALVVTSRVSGNFPGSPAELDFSFVIQNDQIVRLSIG